ncbi:hypothetical protein DL98DRAFT_586684 [Cadophora sp. DSE1049]|nr:hypothetical protein DL98DRAFT_586684 [Cadophora sp. DSE1049]
MAAKEYKRRVALFLAWVDDPRISRYPDPLNINREMNSLRRVLTQGYGFEIITYRMELYKPGLVVWSKVDSFIRGYSDPETLLLVYYGGHGTYWNSQGLVWAASSRNIADLADRNRLFPCRYVLEFLTKASSDVIILICCCSAAPTHPDMAINCQKSKGGTTEIIAACTVGERTSSEYASQIVALLEKRFASGRPTSVQTINYDITKGILRIAEGLFNRDRRLPPPGANPKPVHLQLHGQYAEDTIVLTPVKPEALIVQEPRYSASSWVAKLRMLCGRVIMESWNSDVGDGTGIVGNTDKEEWKVR